MAVASAGRARCKSASCYRQITTPAPHCSVFTGQMPFLPPNQQRQSTEGNGKIILNNHHSYYMRKTKLCQRFLDTCIKNRKHTQTPSYLRASFVRKHWKRNFKVLCYAEIRHNMPANRTLSDRSLSETTASVSAEEWSCLSYEELRDSSVPAPRPLACRPPALPPHRLVHPQRPVPAAGP